MSPVVVILLACASFSSAKEQELMWQLVDGEETESIRGNGKWEIDEPTGRAPSPARLLEGEGEGEGEGDQPYKWFNKEPWTECDAFLCGPQEPKTRKLGCYEYFPDTPSNMIGDEMIGTLQYLESLCGKKPAESETCPTNPVGTPCDDGKLKTDNDQCQTLEAGSCEGKSNLFVSTRYDVPAGFVLETPEEKKEIEDQVKPKIAKVLRKSGMETAPGVKVTEDDINIVEIKLVDRERRLATERRLAAQELKVDFTVAIPKSEAKSQKQNQYRAALEDPTQSGMSANAMALNLNVNGVVQQVPLLQVIQISVYTYDKTEGVCPGDPCSPFCNAVATTVSDTYSCLKDGDPVSMAECKAALGDQPITETECCPDADPAVCIPPAPTPEPTAAPTALDCYGTWMPWSSCSSSCGWGQKTRRYQVIEHEAPGGQACDTSNHKTKCWASECPVDCEGDWGDWGACKKTCGPSEKIRRFVVTQQERFGGKGCPEAPQQMECNKGSCPSMTPERWVIKQNLMAQRKADRKQAKADARAAEKAANKAARMAMKVAGTEAPCSQWCTRFSSIAGSSKCLWAKCKGCDDCKVDRRLLHV